MLKKILYLSIYYLTTLTLLSLLSGCGQTGSLYLPEKPQTPQAKIKNINANSPKKT